ncbi:ABC transporter substrate-binding protein [Paenisporosarcina cavernae]|uniref:ABC transporter substrate-binding protein n=1 Tax=Paenisporosarcina cavernae TaxID=2320858 RepID=A0A385YQ90_9BACL|nr:ABC transporter substrate-binding protein [Paenisporosarcina cavernae]AYC28796.1 ABC transporter substrate-binding protein [Paenisporosarcina cavernae]
MFKKLRLALLVLTLSVFAAACNDETPVQENNTAATENETTYPMTLTDVTGEEITLEKAPEHIVSMIPSNTEILFELGLDEQVVGVSDFDNFPEEAADKEKIGGMEFNVEKIISLSPDLVLAHESALGTWDAGLTQLRDAGIKVYTVKNAESFEETYETIETIGELTNTSKTARNVVKDMKAHVEEITAATKGMEPKSVLVEVSPSPEIYTSAGNTLIDEMLKMIGAENAAADLEGWVKLDPEQIIERNPDVLITTYGSYTPNAVEQVLSRPGFDAITAVKEKAVADIDADMTSRMGPRLDDGLEVLAKAVYPEAFSE